MNNTVSIEDDILMEENTLMEKLMGQQFHSIECVPVDENAPMEQLSSEEIAEVEHFTSQILNTELVNQQEELFAVIDLNYLCIYNEKLTSDNDEDVPKKHSGHFPYPSWPYALLRLWKLKQEKKLSKTSFNVLLRLIHKMISTWSDPKLYPTCFDDLISYENAVAQVCFVSVSLLTIIVT